MNSPTTQFVTPRRLGIYEPIHQISPWGENFKSNGNPNASASMIVEVDAKLDDQVKILTIILLYLKVEKMFSSSNIFFIELPSRRILHMEHWELLTSMNKKQVNLLIR